MRQLFGMMFVDVSASVVVGFLVMVGLLLLLSYKKTSKEKGYMTHFLVYRIVVNMCYIYFSPCRLVALHWCIGLIAHWCVCVYL